MTGLLNTLYPDDDPSTDDSYHRSVRVAAAIAPSGQDSPAPDKQAVERIIRALPNTAPGTDGITAALVKWAWKAASDEMVTMYGKCITEGVFPDLWKAGRLVVLPKNNGKSPSDPKAYRPITLLSILGKILERLIVVCAPCMSLNISPSQHGFVRGRSTVTALSSVDEFASTSVAKYVQLTFLDIAGAFDNAWWAMILLKVKQSGVPPNIYRILVAYFTNRVVTFYVGKLARSKRCTMGCPQGSVLGPLLWNLLLNDLLLLVIPEGARLMAYADDVTVLIEASSRAEIERTAASVLEEISRWARRNRLAFAPGKSQTMTYKGSFKRPPTIKFEEASIRAVKEATLLGVVLDETKSYLPHATSAGEKASTCFGKMSRVSATRWGIRYPALRVLYAGTYVATLCYAAAVWYHRCSIFVVARSLIRTQRPALILLTKAYRSCSSAALPVLAGVLPADLEVARAGRVAKESVACAPRERRQLKAICRADAVRVWEDRWRTSTDGRDLYSFFPDVAARLRSNWIEPDYEVSQLLTGHGCFRERLHRLGLSESPVCPCGEAHESRDHALFECRLYIAERQELYGAVLSSTSSYPIGHQDLIANADSFAALRKFAHLWHAQRSEIEEVRPRARTQQ